MNEELKDFKVMDWLKKIKKESYKAYSKDPKSFSKHLKQIGDKFEKWLIAADKLSKHDWNHLNN